MNSGPGSQAQAFARDVLVIATSGYIAENSRRFWSWLPDKAKYSPPIDAD